jgi:tripartite-type tricarboxylate transporter receptor subunit TctC
MMALGLRSPASAQAYPVKPIHIIVPFAAGGITDVIGRARWDSGSPRPGVNRS